MMRLKLFALLIFSTLITLRLTQGRDRGSAISLLVEGRDYTAPFRPGEQLRYEVN